MPTGRVFACLLLCLLAESCGTPSWPSAGTEAPAAGTRRTLGVNAYLWNASLDTLSFLPLASANPFGGVIMTDWYMVPNKPAERVKVIVYIMDRALRADAIKVTVFREFREGSEWGAATAQPEIARKIEVEILTRARELRVAAAGS